jgi:DNA polymerase-3 subunit alpha
MAGAFDSLGDRGQMYANLDLLLAFNKEHVAGKEAAQDSLFGSIMAEDTVELAPAEPIPTLTMLTWEKDLLGVYVSGHPLDAHAEELAKRPTIGSILDAVNDKNEIAILRLKGDLVTAGMVIASRELITKKGDKMAFVTLADTRNQIEMVVFPKTYAELKPLFTIGSCIAIKGKLTIRNDEPSIALDRAKLLSGQAVIPADMVSDT